MEDNNSFINTSISTLELFCTDGTSYSNANILIRFKTGNYLRNVTSGQNKFLIITIIVLSCIFITMGAALVFYKNKKCKAGKEGNIPDTEHYEEVNRNNIQSHYDTLETVNSL